MKTLYTGGDNLSQGRAIFSQSLTDICGDSEPIPTLGECRVGRKLPQGDVFHVQPRNKSVTVEKCATDGCNSTIL